MPEIAVGVALPPRSRSNLRPRATRINYNEDESDNELDQLQDEAAPPSKKPKRPRQPSLKSALKAGLRTRTNATGDVSKLPNISAEPINIEQALCHTRPMQSLVGREEESNLIRLFLNNALKNKGNSGCRSMLLSGVPGSGKTAIIRNIIQDLREQRGHEFLDAEINCASLTTPKQVYSTAVHKMLETSQNFSLSDVTNTFKKRKRLTPDDAFEIITTISDTTQKTNVLILDEIDWITSQEVLYNIFDMTIKLRSGIVVIGISNTLNFRDKLQAKIASRISLTSVNFKPYTAEQLKSIIWSRLGSVNRGDFDKMAIEFASKKIANISGDVRRMFQLCKLAHDIAVKKGIKPAGLREMLEAKGHMFQSVQSKLIQSCSKSQQVLFIAIIIECKLIGSNCPSDVKIRARHASLSNQLSLPICSTHIWNNLVIRTEALGMIKVINKNSRRNEKISLNVSQDEVVYALKQQYSIMKQRECSTGVLSDSKVWYDYFSWISRLSFNS